MNFYSCTMRSDCLLSSGQCCPRVCQPKGNQHETWPKAVLPLYCPCGIRLVLAGGSLLSRWAKESKHLPLMSILAVWWARDSDLGGGGEGILCPAFSLPLHISGQCSSQSGETWFPAHALRNMGSPGSPENHGWTNIKILGKSISQTDEQAQLFYKGSQAEGLIDCG